MHTSATKDGFDGIIDTDRQLRLGRELGYPEMRETIADVMRAIAKYPAALVWHLPLGRSG